MSEQELCYYCENVAEYNQIVGNSPNEYTVTGVCKKHLVMDVS